MCSVKPFKSKNRDKIFLDAKNPNLKKGCDRDFRATAQPMDYYVCLLDEKFKRARIKFHRQNFIRAVWNFQSNKTI